MFYVISRQNSILGNIASSSLHIRRADEKTPQVDRLLSNVDKKFILQLRLFISSLFSHTWFETKSLFGMTEDSQSNKQIDNWAPQNVTQCGVIYVRETCLY